MPAGRQNYFALKFILVFSWGFSIVHIVDFAFPVQYTTCTGQKQPILSTRNKIICKIS